MIALLYLALLVAWAVFVMVLRCKRAKAQRESENGIFIYICFLLMI